MTLSSSRMTLRQSRFYRTAVLLVILIAGAGLLLLSPYRTSRADSASSSANVKRTDRKKLRWEHVCIIGNAQKEADAIRSHQMWENEFVSLWFVWGEKLQTNPSQLPSRIKLIQTNEKKKAYDCEYVFTHDDDLQFYSYDEKETRPIHKILSDILLRYQPAMVGFPWAVEVSPLTGFDSGMILYHKSIIDFFIPYTPRGEGGFNGHWSLCAHFLTLFAPNLLQGAALRVNALPYTNLISFDNVPEDERKPTKYHMNAPFRTFLSNGMINRQQRWGRDMTEYDLLWRTELPEKTVDRWTILNRLVNFYDITHPVISKNKWIREHFTDSELDNFLVIDQPMVLDFSFVIHVFTLNRKASFDKLWTSINQANQISHPVSIHIHLDTLESDNNAPFFFYVQYLQSLVSLHGRVLVSVNSKHKGLKQSIMDAWTPANSKEFAIFLEDDISVSRHFLEYAEQMVARYLNPRGAPGYSPKCMGLNERNWAISTAWGAVYSPDAWNDFRKWYLAQPPSLDPLIPDSLTNRWLKSRSWKKYLIRYMYTKGKFMIYPNFPGGLSLTTNRLEVGTNDKISGPHRKLMLDRFNVPLLDLERENFGLESTALGIEEREFLRKITAVAENTGRLKMDLIREFRHPQTNAAILDEVIAPLQPGAQLEYSIHMLPMNELKPYDVHFKKVKSISSLLEGITPKSFDKCTLIMEATSGAASLLPALQHYHSFSHLESILVIWNSDEKPPLLKAPKRNAKRRRRKVQYDYRVPIDFVIPDKYNPNNYLRVHPQITTDCIILSDMNWMVAHDQLNFAVSLFQGHFYESLIGFARGGRSHLVTPNKKYEYIAATDGPISILEMSGVVLHRKFLMLYSSPAMNNGRSIVSEEKECRGVLLNMMIAHETNKGPVIISTTGNSTLQIESDVVEKRSNCLNQVSEQMYNGSMDLKYTTSRFMPPKPVLKRSMKVIEYPDEASPSFKQHKFVDKL
ncbi:glycosyl transferase family 64 domain-containing protein [Obelidium mucronatum]|nr:glycosyl transferase family 64 domain-containing protein [Obelidium mucronatum]